MQTIELHSIIGISATILSIIAFIPYIISILKGQTRPSGPSWWTWSILAIVTIISSKASGAPWAILILPIWLFISQLSISLLSIKRGDNNWDNTNKFSVFGALLGVVLWIFTGEPLFALIISIIADFFASIPNFRHIWINPEQENKLGWVLGFGSAVLEIFAIKNWSLAESGWALYFLINMSIVLILLYRPKFEK
jgi:hypothetical protein